MPFDQLVSLLNANEGVVAVTIFCVTLFMGWSSGIFTALRRKPRLRIRCIPGPSFVCTYGTGKKQGAFDVHRTGFALYLSIANVGSAPTSIDRVSLGYRWALLPFVPLWWRYTLQRFWLTDQTVALEDFQVEIGDRLKVYPFLTQRSSLSGESARSFLEIGQATNGVVYFEQQDSWGACFPVSRYGIVRVKVRVTDVFGRSYDKIIELNRVGLADARKYNPSFAKTIMTLRGEEEPVDLPQDKHGNLVPPGG